MISATQARQFGLLVSLVVIGGCVSEAHIDAASESTNVAPSSAPATREPWDADPGSVHVTEEGYAWVHIGMECPNWDYVFVSTWEFEPDQIVPEGLDLDSEIQRGRWVSPDGSGSVSLSLPSSYPVGPAIHEIGDLGGWETVIVDSPEGLHYGTRPLTEDADEFTPRCGTGYRSSDLSVDQLLKFMSELSIEADG